MENTKVPKSGYLDACYPILALMILDGDLRPPQGSEHSAPHKMSLDDYAQKALCEKLVAEKLARVTFDSHLWVSEGSCWTTRGTQFPCSG